MKGDCLIREVERDSLSEGRKTLPRRRAYVELEKQGTLEAAGCG